MILLPLALSAAFAAAAQAATQAAPAPSAVAAPAPPQVSFPGQYAAAPVGWKFPVWPRGCARFEAAERTECLEFVAFDYGRLSRYAAANATLLAPGPGERRVVFFGDSITDNWSKAGYGGFFPGRPYVNRGIGGQTTSQMLVRFRADVLSLKASVVVILAGTNDIAGNAGPVALEDVKANLSTMAELARAHGVSVVLASLLPVSDDKKDAKGQGIVRTTDRPPATILALNQWISEYARKHEAAYLDYYSAVASPDGSLRTDLNDDGLHPNAAGYAVMAPLAEKAVTQALGLPRAASR